MCTLHGRRWRSKISQERLTRGTVCGTMRSMCGADAGCSATNYQSRCTLHGVHKQRQGRKRLHLRKRETISRAHPKGRVSGTSAPRMRLAMSRGRPGAIPRIYGSSAVWVEMRSILLRWVDVSIRTSQYSERFIYILSHSGRSQPALCSTLTWGRHREPPWHAAASGATGSGIHHRCKYRLSWGRPGPSGRCCCLGAFRGGNS